MNASRASTAGSHAESSHASTWPPHARAHRRRSPLCRLFQSLTPPPSRPTSPGTQIAHLLVVCPVHALYAWLGGDQILSVCSSTGTGVYRCVSPSVSCSTSVQCTVYSVQCTWHEHVHEIPALCEHEISKGSYSAPRKITPPKNKTCNKEKMQTSTPVHVKDSARHEPAATAALRDTRLRTRLTSD